MFRLRKTEEEDIILRNETNANADRLQTLSRMAQNARVRVFLSSWSPLHRAELKSKQSWQKERRQYEAK